MSVVADMEALVDTLDFPDDDVRSNGCIMLLDLAKAIDGGRELPDGFHWSFEYAIRYILSHIADHPNDSPSKLDEVS